VHGGFGAQQGCQEEPLEEEMRKRPDITFPFKRANVYDSREDAKKDLEGSEERINRIADARMAAQRLAKRIKKEADWK